MLLRIGLLLLCALRALGHAAQVPGDRVYAAIALHNRRALNEGDDSKVSEISKEVKDAVEAVLIKEFGNETKKQGADVTGKEFNATIQADPAEIETVIRISGSGSTASNEAAGNSSATQEEPKSAAEVIAESSVERSVDRIIDHNDNTFILSNPNADVAALTLDAQLLVDVTVVLVAASLFGAFFEALKQPTINGYLVAGAVVGPGGLSLVQELVQVESLAQMGVSLLLFGLGMELNLGRLKSMLGVTVIGGSLQIILFMVIGGGVAAFMETGVLEGVFIGALLSMSSTSVVVKCLESTNSLTTAFGEITIGTLLLQDCSVGLMFAMMPVFRPMPMVEEESLDEAAEVNEAILLVVLHMLFKLVTALVTGLLIAQYVLSYVFKLLRRHASKELCQLSIVAICLGGAWMFEVTGLSGELGAFIAGVMVSVANTTNSAENGSDIIVHRENIESVHNVMAAMFVASTALIISPRFLEQHFVILFAATVLLMVVKSLLVAMVVTWFGYDVPTSVAVGVCMAHLGEFSIILLSLGRQFKILSNPVYMLLLGIAALSLLSTPFVISSVSMLLRCKRGQHEVLPFAEDESFKGTDHLRSSGGSGQNGAGGAGAGAGDVPPSRSMPILNAEQPGTPTSLDSAPSYMLSSMELPDNMRSEQGDDKSFHLGMSTAMNIIMKYRGDNIEARKHATLRDGT